MEEDEILKQAKKRLADARQQQSVCMMNGVLLDSPDPTGEMDAPSLCSRCNKAMLTTAVNAEIIRLTKDEPWNKPTALLLCPACMEGLMRRVAKSSLPKN